LYRGRDEPRGRTVTIEVLPESLSRDPDWRAGLLREADESRKLSHPNIAALYEIDDQAGRLFLVFDVPPGQTLQAAMGGQPMNVRRALDSRSRWLTRSPRRTPSHPASLSQTRVG
jgi:serine/threonine-protein kinase